MLKISKVLQLANHGDQKLLVFEAQLLASVFSQRLRTPFRLQPRNTKAKDPRRPALLSTKATGSSAVSVAGLEAFEALAAAAASSALENGYDCLGGMDVVGVCGGFCVGGSHVFGVVCGCW